MHIPPNIKTDFRHRYWGWINQEVNDILMDYAPDKDVSDADETVHDTVDQSEFCTYYDSALIALAATENEDAWTEIDSARELFSGARDTHTILNRIVYWAVYQDLRETLHSAWRGPWHQAYHLTEMANKALALNLRPEQRERLTSELARIMDRNPNAWSEKDRAECMEYTKLNIKDLLEDPNLKWFVDLVWNAKGSYEVIVEELNGALMLRAVREKRS